MSYNNCLLNTQKENPTELPPTPSHKALRYKTEIIYNVFKCTNVINSGDLKWNAHYKILFSLL